MVDKMEEGRSAFKILTGKPLGKSMCIQEDNITKDLKEIGNKARNWADSAEDKESPCDPPGCISHEVNYLVFTFQ